MKKTALYCILFLAILSNYSCMNNSEKKKNTKALAEEEIIEESVFKVKLEIIINTDEKLQMYYLEPGENKWDYKKRIPKKIKASFVPQIVEFNIPKEVFPSKLLFDFGEKKSEEVITIISVTMSYEDFKLNLNPQEFYAFFTPNKYIKYTKETGVMNCKAIDGKYDPHFKSRPVFDKRLELEER